MRKNRISRLLISSALAATLVISSATIAFGCTGIYFGKDVTDNGTTLAGRSEDSGWTRYIKNYTVRQAETHEPGDMYVGASSGFTMPYPAKTFRYTLVKDYTGEGEEEMAQVGINEKGVAAEASVSFVQTFDGDNKCRSYGQRRPGEKKISRLSSSCRRRLHEREPHC